MSIPTRVLIADDEPYLRRGFLSYLTEANDIEVIQEASSGPEAVALARRHNIDVVLMDVRMPGGNGIAATRELCRSKDHPRVAVIVITTFDTDENVFDAIDNGAAGVLLKTVEPEELMLAVRTVAAGGSYIDPPLLPRFLREFSRRATPELPRQTLNETGLTTREVSVLYWLTHGLSNEELAQQHHISVGTIKTHLSSIKTKLNLEDRRHLVVWAFKNGLSDEPEYDATE